MFLVKTDSKVYEDTLLTVACDLEPDLLKARTMSQEPGQPFQEAMT